MRKGHLAARRIRDDTISEERDDGVVGQCPSPGSSTFTELNQAGAPRYIGAIEPVELDASLDADAALIAWTAARVSRLVCDYPDQWFVFQPEWLDHRR